jgi:drug/metabolite transporter (DMT)-like permease
VAYANRSAVVIWGILLAWLCLGEALSWTLAAGAALVIGGIILVSTEEAHE